MFGLETLDVALGAVFVYLVLGLVTSACAEYIAQFTKLRGVLLWRAVQGLVADSGLSDKFYAHQTIRALGGPTSTGSIPGLSGLIRGVRSWLTPSDAPATLPSYMPARRFASALLDVIDRETDGSGKEWTVERLRAAVEELGKHDNTKDLSQSLLVLINQAGSSMEQVIKGVEQWYDDTMDRVTGWFKRRLQVILFCIALVVTVATNADVFRIVTVLVQNPAVREALVAEAQNQTEPAGSTKRREATDSNAAAPGPSEWKQDLDKIKPVIGWTKAEFPRKDVAPREPGGARRAGTVGSIDYFDLVWWLKKCAGLLISTICVSLGAPFWFDALRKLLSIRNSIKPKSSTDTE